MTSKPHLYFARGKWRFIPIAGKPYWWLPHDLAAGFCFRRNRR